MGDKIDLALDDIIKMSKQKKSSGAGRGGGGRGRGRSNRGKGGGRGGQSGGGRGRPSPYTRSEKVPEDKWDHDMYSGSGGPVRGSGNRGNNNGGIGKLLVSNLDFGVSDQDVTELFSEFGAMRKSAIHYDRSGRSLGSADVIFDKRSDAVKAMQQYNGVPLDGRAMEIRLVDGNNVSNGSSRGLGSRVGQRNQTGGGNTGRGGGRGRGFGGRGRGRGRGGRQSRENVSAEDLDKQLDDYISKMDTD